MKIKAQSTLKIFDVKREILWQNSKKYLGSDMEVCNLVKNVGKETITWYHIHNFQIKKFWAKMILIFERFSPPKFGIMMSWITYLKQIYEKVLKMIHQMVDNNFNKLL